MLKLRQLLLGAIMAYSALAGADDSQPKAQESTLIQASLQAQRKAYLDAERAFKAERWTQYYNLKARLENYPLLPYLEFLEINQKLDQKPYALVDEFLEQYGDSYPAKRLLHRWLTQAADEKRWHDFRSYYPEDARSTKLQCLNLWAQIKTGDAKAAMAQMPKLWDVGQSQPDECDNAFNYWREQGHLTGDLLWSRYRKAINKSPNSGLTRYLEQLMPASMHKVAEKLKAVEANPAIINQTDRFRDSDTYMVDVVYTGLSGVLKSNPEKTEKLFKQYRQRYTFSDEQLSRLSYKFARFYAEKNKSSRIKPHLSSLNDQQKTLVVERLLRELLKQQDWQAISYWIAKLPADKQQSSHWQYWQARSLEALSPTNTEQVRATYASLAKKRNYYGFLAADRLNQAYSFEHQPLIVEQVAQVNMLNRPVVQRCRELFYLGEMHAARKEWQLAIKGLSSKEEIKTLGQIAYDWGWYRKSIEAMTAVKAWDHLAIRFPIDYKQHIIQQAAQNNIPATLILSIARQESAWQIDAKSSAGAMGLMQLMPQTAKETARKAQIPHKKSNLFEAEHNILLGSRHLKELVEHYDQNRLPAIAAYNAGRGRVNRWLQNSNQQLPFDVWIEVIPFNETRHYVKNVLAYSLVYSWRLGEKSQLVTRDEANNLL